MYRPSQLALPHFLDFIIWVQCPSVLEIIWTLCQLNVWRQIIVFLDTLSSPFCFTGHHHAWCGLRLISWPSWPWPWRLKFQVCILSSAFDKCPLKVAITRAKQSRPRLTWSSDRKCLHPLWMKIHIHPMTRGWFDRTFQLVDHWTYFYTALDFIRSQHKYRHPDIITSLT